MSRLQKNPLAYSLMPKIPNNFVIQNSKTSENNKIFLSKEKSNRNNMHSNVNISKKVLIKDNEKKPGSSIERKKHMYLFPKINQTKLPGTANIKDPDLIKNLSEINEQKKEENFSSANNIINNYNVVNNNNMINQNNVKKYVNNKNIIVDINNYKDISINFLVNNNELKEMFEELYRNDYNAKKKWIELNLFGRDVFKIRLETYIKNKQDIPSFIKNEIYKLLSNQYLDYQFSQSYKQIETQSDELMKNIENIYN